MKIKLLNGFKTKKNKKKGTISDRTDVMSEKIIIRVSPDLKQELYREMEEKNIRKISTYIRQIISKRNAKTVKKTSNISNKNDAFGKEEYRELLTEYNKVLQKFKDISKIKNEDGSPIINEKILYENVKSLNDRTMDLFKIFKEIIDDNQASK